MPADFHFAARALDEVYRAAGRESLGLELALAPSPRAKNGQKLGVGGSARACVLAVEAARFALDLRQDTLKLALLAHAAAQSGKGSGGDVAAIFAGGVVRYRRFPVAPLVEASNRGALGAALAGAPPVDVFRLPTPKLHLSYVYVGQSASTRELIREVEAKLTEDDRRRFVQVSDEHGARLEAALAEGDFAEAKDAVQGLQANLATLGPGGDGGRSGARSRSPRARARWGRSPAREAATPACSSRPTRTPRRARSRRSRRAGSRPPSSSSSRGCAARSSPSRCCAAGSPA